VAPLQIPPEAGPQDGDPSTVHFPYYSTVDLVPHQYSGLVGVFVVATPGTLAADGALFEYSIIKPSMAADVLHTSAHSQAIGSPHSAACPGLASELLALEAVHRDPAVSAARHHFTHRMKLEFLLTCG